MAQRRPFIATYIMASGRNGWVYVGMTSNLHARVWKHKNGRYDGYTAEHGCDQLVWYEQHALVTEAIAADWYPVTDPNWEPPTEED